MRTATAALGTTMSRPSSLAGSHRVSFPIARSREGLCPLKLNPARIGIKGESGGGGFAAAASLYARDRQGPKFAFQHLIYPMIDDRTAVRKDLHPYVGEFVWTQENNYFGWRSLLGEEPGSADVSPYAAAARAAECRVCLQPTFRSAVLISSSKKT
jgi:acetyl esterase/lipase